MPHVLQFVPGNDEFPASGVLTSTARRGDKWFNKAKPGELLDLMLVKNDENVRRLGQAVVIGVELTSLEAILEDAASNHAIQAADFNLSPSEKRKLLADALERAYGPLESTEVFTKLSFMILEGMGTA